MEIDTVSDSDAELDKITEAYIRARAQEPQLKEHWLRAYPHYSDELAEFIDIYEQMKPEPDRRPDFGSDFDQAEFVGKGGMAVVHRAHQISLDRTVALKTINTGLFATSQERIQLHREAQAAAKLKHPNIVTIHGIHEAGDLYFISMEYIGKTMGDLIPDLQPVPAAKLMLRVAEAVQFAHESGVIHRDLKPSNILIEVDRPIVADFGLAKVEKHESPSTYPGNIVGSLPYMSPEQARGEKTDARSDVYSLGATLYHAITRQQPFRGAPAEILALIQHSAPDRPRLIDLRIPPELETICLRCLEKNPEDRYVSAKQLADDLRLFIEDRVPPPPVNHWFEKFPSLASVGLFAGPAAALLILLTTGAWAGIAGWMVIWFHVSPAAAATSLILLEIGAWASVAAIAAWMVIWWITEAVPAAATAFLPLILFPILGVMAPTQVAKAYVDDNLFLVLGGMLIALGLEDSGISRRFALKIIQWFGRNPSSLILGLMVATAFISMWLSNTATTLAMLPIAFGLTLQMESDSDPKDTTNFRKAALLGIAYATTAGGMGTPVGTPTNHTDLLAQSYPISFLQWMLFGVPCVVLLTTAAWLLLVRYAFPLKQPAAFPSHKKLVDGIEKMGPVSAREWRMLAIAVVTVFLWFLRPKLTGAIAMAMALVCFIVPVGRARGDRLLNSKVISRLPWSVLLLFGGGLALAAGVNGTGLESAMGQYAIGALAALPSVRIVQALAVSAAAAVLTQLTPTNLSTAAIFIPILNNLDLPAHTKDLLVFVATLGVSCDFLFPFASPPNAIVFGTGRLTMRDMMRPGIWLTLLGVIVVAVCVTGLLRTR